MPYAVRRGAHEIKLAKAKADTDRIKVHQDQTNRHFSENFSPNTKSAKSLANDASTY